MKGVWKMDNTNKLKLSTFYIHVMEGAEQSGISIDEAIERVKAMGYTAFDIGYRQNWIPVPTEEVIEKIHAHGMKIANFFVNADFAHEFDREWFEGCIDCIAKSDTNLLQLTPGLFGKDDNREEALEKMVAAQKEVVAMGKEKGVIVTAEDFDHIDSPINTIRGMENFFDKIPDLGFTFDTGNFFLMEENCLDAFELFKDKLHHVHLKDRALVPFDENELDKETYTGKKMYASPAGYGVVDMKKCIELIKSTGYDGYLAVEHFCAKNQLDYLEKSAEFVKKAWNNA